MGRRVYRSLPPDEPSFTVPPSEIARQKRLAREQREAWERRFRDPTPVEMVYFDDGEKPESMRLDQFLALWTWTAATILKDSPVQRCVDSGEPGWVFLGFRRLRMTPKRVRKWRRQCGLRKGDLLHIVPLTGRAPSTPPLYTNRHYLYTNDPDRAGRGKAGRRGLSGPTGRLKGAKPRYRVDPRRAKWARLPRCQYEHQKGNTKSRCQHPALWRVGYTASGTATLKRPALVRVKHACGKHVWKASLLPKNAKWPVRILAKGFFRPWEVS